MKKKEPTVVDVLRRMKALLRKGWNQGVSAKGKSGKPVLASSLSAVSFCLLGAQSRALVDLHVHSFKVADAAWDAVSKCIPRRKHPVDFNDAKGRTKEEVLSVVDCAIKKASV